MIKYKIAFLTESGFTGKYSRDFPNTRTEIAWQIALDADHYPISSYDKVSGYDFIFIIWPKGDALLNSEGIKLSTNHTKIFSAICRHDVIGNLKQRNNKVLYVQEGPVWFPNDYILDDQIHHLNILNDSDAILCHNSTDINWYRGIVPNKPVTNIHSLMIHDTIKDIKPTPEKKVMIGGNFCRWYGGFQSFLVSRVFNDYEKWAPTMHNKQQGEEYLVKHLPYMNWTEWIRTLSTFKVGVHLMPTTAAGTFSLNCAYLGIPCVGNVKLDTQVFCHPSTSVDVNDLEGALQICDQLHKDKDFYEYCSNIAKSGYADYYNIDRWLYDINSFLNKL